MRSVLPKSVIAAGLLAGLFSQQAQAAAPASPQGLITFKTYAGDQRAGIRAGTATPDGVFYPKRMEGPYNGYPGDDPGDEDTLPVDVREGYNMELIGYFYPPKTGKIQFAITTDDPGELWFSTDDTAANKVQIASESQWNPKRGFGGAFDGTTATRRNVITTGDAPVPRPENWSKFIQVTAGKPYWIQSIGTEFGGGDNNAVAFRYDGDADFADNDHPIAGQYLSTIDRISLSEPYLSGFISTPGEVAFLLHDGGDPGGKPVDAASIKVTIDGAAAQATVNKSGAVTTASSKVTPFFAPNTSHTSKVEFNGQSVEKTFTIVNYSTLPASLKVTADTSKPGFSVLTYQIDSALPTTVAAANEVVLGLRKDADGNNLPNVADLSGAGADGRFVFADVFNVWDNGAQGNFPNDTQNVPGIATGDNYAVEILTFLDLPAGIVTMGFNSDDGFQTSAGNVKDALGRTVLGQFDGGRGAADTIFTFEVKEAGVYPFRTIWFEGGGDSNAEWFSINAGKNVLINDKADPTSIKAYRASSTPTPAYIKTVSPSPGAGGVSAKTAIGAVLVDGGSTIDQASIKLNVNGQPTSPKITKTGAETAVDYTPAADLPIGTKIPVEITYKDSAGTSRTASWSFQVEIATSVFVAGTLFIEAEDVDYGHGKYVKDKKIGMDGAYDGGAYNALGTADDKGFDWNIDSNNGQAYRPDTAIAAGKENGTAGSDRGLFQVTSWWTLGWNDAGEWYNYTRDFPTPAKDYAVYGHLSSGGAAINIQLDQVTAGQTQDDSKQVKKKLGVFTPGRATAGWDNLEIFQMTDDKGEPAIVNLGGNVTLRATIQAGSNSDEDYYAFVPSTAAAKPKISSIALSGGSVTITYSGGTLQSTTALPGGWADVAGATSPYSTPPSGTAQYYRLKQ